MRDFLFETPIQCEKFRSMASSASTSSTHAASNDNDGGSTLFPGCKHVESFGPDDDYEEGSGEECYVTLDLGSVDQTLVPSSSTYRLVVCRSSTLLDVPEV
jgi:hypothetical protein